MLTIIKEWVKENSCLKQLNRSVIYVNIMKNIKELANETGFAGHAVVFNC